MGGIQYVYWPGTTTRLTPWMLHCLQRLDADLQRLFGVRLSLDSSDVQRGIRTYQEQVDLFLSRYRLQGSGGGPFGDVRVWQGRRYVRHSGLGTVAQPGTSNHEIQGAYAAVDLADSGGPGIGSMGSERSNWLRANAANYGLEPEGFKFDEAWHYRVPNIFTPVPAGSGKPLPLSIGDDAMYIKARSQGSWASKGVIYTNNKEGHWRGITNLEDVAVQNMVKKQGLVITELDGSDLDLLFAVNGVWEQQAVDSNTAPRWGKAPGTPLMGLGFLTGRLMYPGREDGWHYPIAQTPPDVKLAEEAAE